jgi:hypothetical protein
MTLKTRRAGRFWLLALAMVAAAAVVVPGASAVTTPPPGKIISIVYCPNRQNVNCIRVGGRGRSHYKRAPRGYDRRLRCRWYDTGYGASLGMDKHYCVIRH